VVQWLGDVKMEIKNSTLVWIGIAILFLVVIFLTYKSSTGNAIAENGKLDTTGWSENEKMNYDMHGTVPARLQGKVSPASSSSGSQMVGGC